MLTAVEARNRRIPSTGAAFAFFVVLLLLGALDAYNVGRIPLTWISQLGSIACICYIALRYRLAQPHSHRRLWLFCGWAAIVTVVNAVFGHYAQLMPSGGTTSYPLFVVLRFLTVLSFIAALYLIYWLLLHGSRERIVKATIILGTIISVVALYVYVAQVYGLPEPPRTRLGTSGALQSVTFTYDFHRAEGTFREPSLLAAWLLVPFLLSLTVPNRLYLLHSILMGGTLLLTGSLSGIVALVVGLLAASAIAAAYDARSLRFLLRAVLVVPIALALFYFVARSAPVLPPRPPATAGPAISSPCPTCTPTPTANPSPTTTPNHSVDLFATLSRRITNILVGGLGNSDRNQIYDYVFHNRPPLFGTGLGNANLLLGQYLHSKVVAGFISLYLVTLYATGIIGLVLLANYVLSPPFDVIRRRALWGRRLMVYVMAAYLAWLVDFAAGTEELTFMFAIAMALMAYEMRGRELPQEADGSVEDGAAHRTPVPRS